MHLSLPVRSSKTAEVAHPQCSGNDHHLMIQALRGTDSWALGQLCGDHAQGAKNDYLAKAAAAAPPSGH